MSQAHVDPQSLRQFNDELKQFNEFIEEALADIHHKLNGLGQTWRDGEYEKFVDIFQTTARLLENFNTEANVVIPQLEKEADLTEKFQRIRM